MSECEVCVLTEREMWGWIALGIIVAIHLVAITLLVIAWGLIERRWLKENDNE